MRLATAARLLGTLGITCVSLSAPVTASDSINIEIRALSQDLTSQFEPSRLYDRHGVQDAAKYETRTYANTALDLTLEQDRGRFGVLRVNSGERIYAVYPVAIRTYCVLLDLNANGRLRDETPVCSTAQESRVSFTIEDGDLYRIQFPLLGSGDLAEHAEHFITSRRTTVLEFGDERLTLVLQAYRHRYESPDTLVCIDADRNGYIDLNDANSHECTSLEEGAIYGEVDAFDILVSSDGRVATITRRESSESRPRLAIGDLAPNIAFVDPSGERRMLSDLRGQFVLLYGWATWCGPCVEVTARIQSAYERMRWNGIEVIGVPLNDYPENVDSYIRDKQIPWVQALHTGADDAAGQLRLRAVPYLILVGPDSRIAARNTSVEEVIAIAETDSAAESR